LQGCGFHLRGSGQIAERYNPVYLQPGELDSAQFKMVNNALEKAGARLSARTENSNQLNVRFEPLQTRKLAGSSASGIEIRRLSQAMHFRLISPYNVELLQNRVDHSSELQLDSNNVLSHENLIKREQESLQQSLVRTMIYQLQH
jgi:outer membrane lipopolysaccharide assembly protein LptE/RlpB